MLSAFALVLMAVQSGAMLMGPAWEVGARGPRYLDLRLAAAEAESGCQAAAAKLVPCPGGAVPSVEILELDTAAAAPGDGAGSVRDWVSFGKPVRAAGLELVPMVVNLLRKTEPAGRAVRCRGMRVRLSYERPAGVTNGKGVMGRLIGSLAGGEQDSGDELTGYLIVVPDEFYSNVQPLAAWKERRGFKVWVKKTSETGSQREQIRDYIRTAYNTWTPVPSYVVLVGAVSKIPAFITEGTPCVTDHHYACVDGDDMLADLFVGRLPAANASELDVMVAKTVGYESAPELGDTAWFTRALMVGTSYQEGGTPAVTAIMTKRLIRERLLERGFTQIDTVYYPPTASGRGPVDSAVNRGVSFVNGRGWGNRDGWGYPQFLTNDVYGLANGWKLPVVTSIYCGTGNFAANPCFGEAWLRAGTPANPKGGVAFWGSSWSGTSTRWNNCMDYAIYQAIFDWGIRTCGPAMYLGKLAQYEGFPMEQDTFDLRVYFYVYNLLGDPSLEMWTGAPQQLTVTYPEQFSVGTSSFEVLVRGEQSQPVEGASVCLLKAGEVHAVQRTDGSGRARFAVATASADTMLVTVTGADAAPHLGTSRAVSSDVFVGHDGHSPQSAAPNGDISLEVTLRNFGTTQTASGVNAVLRSLDAGAAVTDSVRAYGDLAPGAASTAPGFGVQVAASCTSSQVLRFEVETTSSDSTWYSAFGLDVAGPTLKPVGYEVPGGNGWLDPGETAELVVTVANSGSGPAGNVSAALRSLSPFAVTVLDSLGSFGTIPPGDSGANSVDRFQVRASAAVGAGRRFGLLVVMTGDGGFVQSWHLPVTVGEPVAAAPLGPDRHGYYAYDDTDAGYSEQPVFEWTEIDPGHGGSGTRVELGNDTAVPVRLPFTFRFYGQDFDTVSVADNGYVAMGNAWFSEIYNWPIPSANGPDGFAAVFWDDFRPDTLDASGVYTHWDQASHRFVIEWSRCYHVHGFRPPELGEQQTFQVILEDPEHHQTKTGDGPLLFQYLVVQNDDTVWGNSHNWATVGIQNPGHDDGIEYTFAGSYPGAAAVVAPSRAVRFTTNPPDTFTGVADGQQQRDRSRCLRLLPNPVRTCLSIELSEAGADRLEVIDVLGRQVCSIAVPGQMAVLSWDLRDSAGRRVPVGIYYLRLTSGRVSNSIPGQAVLVLGREAGPAGAE